MRLPKRGQKGFTLIELLIVIAILGVLAAVVIPNVQQFIGAGREEAAETELANIQTAVVAMMVDNGLSTLLNPVDGVAASFLGYDGNATNDMSAFPDRTTLDPIRAAFAGAGGEVPGYLLYGNQIIVDIDGDGIYDPDVDPALSDGVKLVNYVATQLTSEYYIVDANGTVSQWQDATTPY